ncbi:MAG: PocR ligand-binding domain-containing protein, partial [Sideroxyarcus sp.]|nr:PocR ligand-binding domain-containing protein [Sideroxyarcus sp.]
MLWGAALLAFVLAGLGVALFQSLTLEHRARQIMEPYAQLVSVGTDAAVAFEDPLRAQEILDTLRANPQILEADIFLDSGRILASFSRLPSAIPRPLPTKLDGLYLDHDTAELLQALPRGGRLRLSMGLQQLGEQTQQAMWIFGAGVLVLLMVTFAQLAVLRRMIVTPIATLTEATELVRAKADYKHRVPASGTDEVARLGQNFNAMMEAIQEREDDLRRLTLLQRTILDNVAYGVISTKPDGIVTSFNPAAERLLGYSANEVVGKQTPACWHDPEEIVRHAVQLSEELGEVIAPGFDVFAARPRRNLPEENEWTFIRKDGKRIPVNLSVTALRGEGGQITGFVGLTHDLTERKKAEQQRLAHLKFLENLNQINRAIQGANNLEQMMSDVLDAVLSIFDCDRAFLMYPCDPEATSWWVPMEQNKPEYPGVLTLGLKMPMTPDVAATLRILLANDGPVQFGPGTPYNLPADVSEQFGFKCFMSMAIHPKVDSPWQFGMHQCSYVRVWSAGDERLFQEIGRRLSDALTSLLTHRNLQESEDRYRRITESLTDYQYSVRIENGRAVETKQSAACATVTGYTPEEFAADPYLWIRMVAPEDRELIQGHMQQILAGKEILPIEHRIIRKDGKTRWVNDTTILFKDASGNLLSYDGVIKDITERKRTEGTIRALNETLESRLLALTQPVGEVSNIQLNDLFNIDELQKIQDAFALATGVASIITDRQGIPITKPSNFCRLCEHIIRKTEKGLLNCYHSDAILGRMNPKEPILQRCLSGGLWDAGTSIYVGDQHIANWLIGQVLEEPVDEESMLAYAGEIGADEEEFRKALSQVTRMPLKQFEEITNALYLIANQLSKLAIQNVQQARFITERKRVEDALVFVAQRGWQTGGENFFDALAQFLGEKLEMDSVLIDRLVENPDMAE